MIRGQPLNQQHECLRVAVVAACPFPSLRGSQVLIRTLAEGLAERGHEIHLVTHSTPETRLATPGIHLHRVRSRLSAPRIGSWKRMILDFRLLIELLRVVRAHRIEVIHAHNYEGQLVSYIVRCLSGIPVVYHAHNLLADELPWYVRGKFLRALTRWIGSAIDHGLPRLADHSLTLSEAQSSALEGCGVPRERMTQVDPCVEMPSEAQLSLLKSPKEFDGKFVVMYAGNLDGYQNLCLLLEGFRRFRVSAPNAVMVFVVHVSDATFDSEARRCGAAVILAPTFEAMQATLSRADILVCPRTSWSGFPIKLINYMQAGRAIVTADGPQGIVRDGESGVHFRRDDADSLAAQLVRLYADPSLRARLGSKAKMNARRYADVAHGCERIEGVYSSVARASRGQAKRAMLQGLIGFRRERISAGVREESAFG